MVKLISHSADETEQIGEKIAKKLHGTEVIALFGGLGMGKTAFTRGLARTLGREHLLVENIATFQPFSVLSPL